MSEIINNTHFYNTSDASNDLFTILFTTDSSEMSDGFESSTFSDSNFSSVNVTSSRNTTLLLYDILIPAIGALAIVMNLAVVISSGLILKKGQQPRSTYLFLGNVAMTDLITSIAIVFGQAFPSNLRDYYICAIQLGMIVSSTLASVYSVGLIAIDRFLYILHGLQYQRWIYPFRARMCIVTTWIIGCIVGFLPLMGWAGDTQNGKICWFILLAPRDLILLTVIVGILPLILVIVLYSIILYHAIKKIVQLQHATAAKEENKVHTNDSGLRMFRGRGNISDSSDIEESTNVPKEEKSLFKRIFSKKPQNNVNNPSKWKAIKVVVFTTGSFVVTWSPYFIASVMYAYCDDVNSPRCKKLRILIASPLAILGFFNSLINPIIYAWWHKGFRTFVTQKLDSIRKKKNSTSHSSKNTSSTSENRKISNSGSSALKLNKVAGTSALSSKETILGSTENVLKEDGSENKSFSKSEATGSTSMSKSSLNSNEKLNKTEPLESSLKGREPDTHTFIENVKIEYVESTHI